MTSALIGYTGFVGSNLLRQTHFDDLYNSKNIMDIEGRKYDLVVCAGAPAEKWKADKDPQADAYNLAALVGHLLYIEAKKFIIISTVDVYGRPQEVDEDSPIRAISPRGYGANRAWLERAVSGLFENAQIIRLGGVFGMGLKKNPIYDLIHKQYDFMPSDYSTFQFYPIYRLWADILKTRARVRNLVTEPISYYNLRKAIDKDDTHYTALPDEKKYDVHTKFDGPYLESSDEILTQIKDFISNEVRSPILIGL